VFNRAAVARGAYSSVHGKILNDWGAFLAEHFELTPDLYVYLRTSPEICLERLKRRGRPEEGHYTLEMLQELEGYHNEWLLKQNETRVLVINGDVDSRGQGRLYYESKVAEALTYGARFVQNSSDEEDDVES
jgi:deoxyadenosine/deoxycytidine kinase